MKKLLIIFSYKYPFSPPVEQFLHMEISYHSNENTDIWLVPYARDHSIEHYNLSSIKNVTIKPIVRKERYKEIFSGIAQELFHLKSACSEVNSILKNKDSGKRKKIKSFFRSSIQAYGLFQEIKATINLDSLSVYSDINLYSYWLNPMSVAICHYKNFLNKHGIDNVSAIARAHGQGDLYLEKENDFYRPNANILSEEIDMIYSVSKNGMYYLNRQGISNVTVSRLGVTLPKILKNEGFEKNEEKLIVSCSVINSNKRVSDIAKAIAMMEIPIRWIHFGSGPEEQQLIQWCMVNMPSHINWKINGWTSNNVIIDFYKKFHPDVFLNLSHIEGIPVSIMEAMSCGIPCVATDVGASNEIVQNGINGYLVSRYFEIQEVVWSIQQCLGENCIVLKKEARRTIENLYDASKNFQEFSTNIWKLNKRGGGEKKW